MMPNLRGCVCSEEAAAFHAEKHSRCADFTALMTSAVCCVVFLKHSCPQLWLCLLPAAQAASGSVS